MSWKDKNWKYIPAAAHADAAHFRRRMQMRAKRAEIERQLAVAVTTLKVTKIRSAK